VFTAQGRSAALYAERNYESRKKYLEALAQVPEERRVYVDETGFNAPLIREHGYAREVKSCTVSGQVSGLLEPALLRA
jgi:hypothetical protein